MQDKSILNENLLYEIASRLGHDWNHLGFYLKLELGVLNDLQESVTVPVTQKPFQMFKRWRKIRSQRISEVQELSEALIKCRRRDLSEFVRNNCHNKENIDDVVLNNLSHNLIREWFELGSFLKIPWSDLNIINESIVA